jgi:hypothetical protein
VDRLVVAADAVHAGKGVVQLAPGPRARAPEDRGRTSSSTWLTPGTNVPRIARTASGDDAARRPEGFEFLSGAKLSLRVIGDTGLCRADAAPPNAAARLATGSAAPWRPLHTPPRDESRARRRVLRSCRPS